MKKSVLLLILIMLLVSPISIACDDDNNNNNSENNTDEIIIATPKLIRSSDLRVDSTIDDASIAMFVKGQYDLNFELMREVENRFSAKNAMLSTYSIQMALGMVWAGASGETANEMESALHYNDKAHELLNKIDVLVQSKNKDAYDSPYEHIDAVEVKTSNNLYFSPLHTWQPEWLSILSKNYDAGVWETDFETNPEGARRYINNVVSQDTHNRIQELIPLNGITSDTRFVITNAIYFKTPWIGGVSKYGSLVFHKLDGSTVAVDQLVSTAHYNYVADAQAGYQAVSVPLRDGDFQIMLILPEKGKYNDLMTNLDGSMIDDIFENSNTQAEVSLKFPIYQFETSLELKEILKARGMNLAFQVGNAEFSKMTVDKNNLYIGQIHHKTFIGVDEKGIEAAAATAVIGKNGTAMPEKFVEMTLDRPFFFTIYETKTRSPLFVGRVLDPTAK